MSIIVNNSDNQLNIEINKVLDVYSFKSIKSVSRGVDANGNYYIAINFIANDKNNSLRIYLKDVSDPITWTNDLAGANAALADIRSWMNEIIDVQINEANDSIQIYASDGTNNVPVLVGQQACSDSLAVTLCDDQAQVLITPVLLPSSNSTGDLTAYSGSSILSISFANDGTADADISVDAEANYIKLAPGMTINLDANGVMNYYDPNLFYWNTSITPGASLLIAFNYI
jgi:hypothetical protein